MHNYMREENAKAVNHNKNMARIKTRQDAAESKQEKQMNKEIWMHNKHNE